ncbi:methyltransferase domain-containing protein [Sinomonas atrocyanea]
MSGCCGPGPGNTDPTRYSAVFTPSFSRSITRRYERKGLRPVEQRIVDFLAGTGIGGASVLEIGGGVGEIQLELLKRGAARTENLELSDAYESNAERLVERAGLAGRVSRRLGVDIAETPDAVGPADVVILHRVVCCYPDYEKLLGAAARHARRALVFSYPPRNVLHRAGFTAVNAFMRATGKTYRGYTHDPAAMVDVVRRHGLDPVYAHRGLAWHITGAVRAR